MPPLTPEQREILVGITKRYGQQALPQVDDYSTLPDEYWRTASGQLADEPDDGSIASRLFRSGVETHPVGGPAKTVWDKLFRPTLERSEEIGQLAVSPIIQAVVQPGFDKDEAYSRQFRTFFDELRQPDGGLDFAGATHKATDAGDYYPGVVGAAGVIGDPLNLLPYGKTGQVAKGVGRITQAAKEGLRPGVTQAGREAVAGAMGYPAAMGQEAEDVGRLAQGAGLGGWTGGWVGEVPGQAPSGVCTRRRDR